MIHSEQRETSPWTEYWQWQVFHSHNDESGLKKDKSICKVMITKVIHIIFHLSFFLKYFQPQVIWIRKDGEPSVLAALLMPYVRQKLLVWSTCTVSSQQTSTMSLTIWRCYISGIPVRWLSNSNRPSSVFSHEVTSSKQASVAILYIYKCIVYYAGHVINILNGL